MECYDIGNVDGWSGKNGSKETYSVAGCSIPRWLALLM